MTFTPSGVEKSGVENFGRAGGFIGLKVSGLNLFDAADGDLRRDFATPDSELPLPNNFGYRIQDFGFGFGPPRHRR